MYTVEALRPAQLFFIAEKGRVLAGDLMGRRPFVYDNSAWHLPEVRRRGLPDVQAGVHIGHVFAWLVGRGLLAPWLAAAEPRAFADFQHGHISGRALLARLGGALASDMLTDEGAAFAAHYLDPRVGAFLDDYRREIVADADSDYHVPDDPDTTTRVAALLQRRFDAWRPGWDGLRPDPWGIDGVDRPPELPDRLVGLPGLPVGRGVPLPGAAISARLRTPGAIAAVHAALRADLLLVLLPEGADDVGVVAWVEEATDEGEGRFLVGLRCLARAARDPEGGWRVHRDAPPTEAQRGLLDEVRRSALAEVARRRADGRPLGLLALVPAVDGGALLDLVARELELPADEQLVVLEAFDLDLRARQVADGLARLG